MSRSYRKPYGPVARGASMKEWRRQAAKSVRNSDDVANGSSYKKLEDVWGSPSDGKCYYGNDPKARRK